MQRWTGRRRKMNKITIILLSLIILMMPLIACAPNNNAVEIQAGEYSRMVIIEKAHSYVIAYDRYTKVMYAISAGGYSTGIFTLLVDSDGNPLLYGN